MSPMRHSTQIFAQVLSCINLNCVRKDVGAEKHNIHGYNGICTMLICKYDISLQMHNTCVCMETKSSARASWKRKFNRAPLTGETCY